MPVERSVYKRRDGTYVTTLPKTWVQIVENKSGKELKGVYMKLLDEKIIITPKFDSESDQREPKKTKYKTVSIPRGLTDDIQKLMDEYGYWPSMSAFVREAALEKLKREVVSTGKIIAEPIMVFTREEREKKDAITEIHKLVLEAENDPNVSEGEKELIRDFASQVSEKLIELESIFKNGDEED